MQELEHLFIAS